MTAIARSLTPSGSISRMIMKGDPFDGRPAGSFLNVLKHAVPRPGLSREVNLWRLKNLPNIWRGVRRIWPAKMLGIPTYYGAVFVRVRRGKNGPWTEMGLGSLRVLTDAGVADVVTRFAGTTAANIANYKFHGFGLGTGAEAAGDTALGTELTTQYAVDNTRPTGSQAAATNTYTTVGTLSPDSGGTLAITEHGVFNASSAGTLLDRSKFAASNLVAGADSLQITYVLTLPSGG